MNCRPACALISVVLLSACASGPPAAPGPTGRFAINDDSVVRQLEVEARERVDTEYDEAAREARAALFRQPRRFTRPIDPETLAVLPRTGIVDRTVSVPFGFGSARFMPSPEQALRIRELFARAERIEVRGRTDGLGTREGDEMIARMRADAAKRYLIDRGVPGRIISVGYIAGGDYVADNARLAGRRKNRRVDIEFIVSDDLMPTQEEVSSLHRVSGS